jgi:hypothetical protein
MFPKSTTYMYLVEHEKIVINKKVINKFIHFTLLEKIIECLNNGD